MDIRQIEDEALHLPREAREALIRKLVMSLDVPDANELRREWLAEAARRARELESGEVDAVPGDDVLRKARALIR
ncbi:addiction module protein [Alcanivorax sp. S71-1-4]|uniref:addiction module protein n=1 Tax=Alcanivorax sp. S71-1-4 TaxID=1177159 RepID=UPI001356C0D0|nr:addiction module protein [Alcanivorax sp. S71-1-4]KAF0810890.1 addiction module protein [Alcanivorax sp. S71-1-4]